MFASTTTIAQIFRFSIYLSIFHLIKSSEGDNDHTRGLYFITIVLSLFILFTIVPFVISIANDPEVFQIFQRLLTKTTKNTTTNLSRKIKNSKSV